MMPATVVICALMVLAGKSEIALFVFLGGMAMAMGVGGCR